MSHNRRQYSGGGGGRRLGGGVGIGGGGGGVSPWEGGMVPGTSRPSSAGILGAAPQPLNLLSQLSTPEAQLALASNLITSLLGQQQQQQQQMQQPRPLGPQPLLSIGSIGPGSGRFYPPPEGLKQQAVGPMRQRSHNARFPDMYNKQRDPQNRQRQQQVNFKRNQGGRGEQRKVQPSGRTTVRNAAGSKPKGKVELQKSDAKSKEDKQESMVEEEDKSSTKKADEKGEENKDANESKEEEEEEGEMKRGWKDEKNKKDQTTGSKPDGQAQKGDASKAASRYNAVPKELLVCHICSKNMWDGQSFENHLRGKSHQMMMDQTEKSYKIQVKLMRQELKLSEEKREIEMERIQRLGKKVNIKSREYCTMCDLYFFGNIMGHRKNQLHQNLKNFLHPRCTLCSQEFPSRTEWDNHQLSPLHLQKLSENKKVEDKEMQDNAMVVEDKPAESGTEDMGEVDGSMQAAESEEDREVEAEADPGTEAEAETEAETEAGQGSGEEQPSPKKNSVSPAQDKPSDASNIDKKPCQLQPQNATPKKPSVRNTQLGPYDPKKTYGTNLLKKVLGYTCDVCNRFFFQNKEAMAHCQTLAHYKNFAVYLKKGSPSEPKEQAGKSDGTSEPAKKRLLSEVEGQDPVENGENQEEGTGKPSDKSSLDQSVDSVKEAAVPKAAVDKPVEPSAEQAEQSKPEPMDDEEKASEVSADELSLNVSSSLEQKVLEEDAEECSENLVEVEDDLKKDDPDVSPKSTSSVRRGSGRRGVARGRGHRRK